MRCYRAGIEDIIDDFATRGVQVKNTAPAEFQVRPSVCTLQFGQSLEVQITVLPPLDGLGKVFRSYRFVVQAVAAPLGEEVSSERWSVRPDGDANAPLGRGSSDCPGLSV